MQDLATTNNNIPDVARLDQLAAEINAIKAEVKLTVYLNTCRIGEKLLQAKAAVGHGNWGQWLADNVDYSERTAQNIITIYKNFNDKEVKLFGSAPDPELLAKLNQSQLLALTSIKDEEKRNEFMDEHKEDLPDMSKKELADAIKELDESRAERSKLQEQTELQEKKLADNEVVMADMKRKLDALRQELTRADKKHEEIALESEKYQNLFNEAKGELEELKKAPIETTTVTVEKMPEEKEKELGLLRERVKELEAAKPKEATRTPEEKQFARHFENIRSEAEALMTQISYMDNEMKYKYAEIANKLFTYVAGSTAKLLGK